MITMYPKISIITPSYNQAQFLEETILSVLNQNYPNLEYIIIDGGSTDGSVEIIKKYQDRIAYWVSEKDEGHGDALNKGFKKATGEILAWINSDDKYHAWAFSIVAEIFVTNNDVNWIAGLPSIWNKKGELIAIQNERFNMYAFILMGFRRIIQQESVFFRKSLWEKAGGYISRDYKLMIDSELWSRFFAHDTLYNVNTCLAGFRFHTTNRSQLFSEQCAQEHTRSATLLYDNSPEEVKKRVRTIQLFYKIKHSRFTRYFNFDFLHRLFAPDTYTKINFKVITYSNETWKIKEEKFDYV